MVTPVSVLPTRGDRAAEGDVRDHQTGAVTKGDSACLALHTVALLDAEDGATLRQDAHVGQGQEGNDGPMTGRIRVGKNESEWGMCLWHP